MVDKCKGWEAIVEPSISTSAGKRIPDLIVSHPELADVKVKGGSTIYSHVVNVQICRNLSPLRVSCLLSMSSCANNGVVDPDQTYYDKVNKYSMIPEVDYAWLRLVSNNLDMARSSKSKNKVNLLSQVVVEQGKWIWQQSKMSTTRSLDPQLL